MMFRRGISILIISVVSLSMLGCSKSVSSSSGSTNLTSSSTSQKEGKKDNVVKIKIANIYADETYESKSMYKFKELIEEKSDSIQVEVYCNSQLGNEETLTDGVRQGSVEMCVTGTTWTQYLPKIGVAEYPYLFNGWDHAQAVLSDPDILAEMGEGDEAAGVKFLGIAPAGFRNITSNKPITKITDFKGFRFRVPNIPLYLNLATFLGANPVAMSFSELFTGLEQKVVDGQENPYSTIIANKLYEVQKYAIDTKHTLTAHGWYINKNLWDGLSNQQRKDIQDCANEAIRHCWDISIAGDEADIKYLQENGMEIIFPDEAFMADIHEAVDEPMFSWFTNEYPNTADLIKKCKEYKY